MGEHATRGDGASDIRARGNEPGPVTHKSPPFWTRLPARRLQFTLDIAVLAAAFGFSYLLRFDFALSDDDRHAALIQLPLVVLLQFLALSLTGVYAFIWRYIGLSDLRAFAWAALASSAPLLALRYGLPSSLAAWRVPVSVIIMDTFFAFGGALGLRLLRRVLYERYERLQHEPVRGGRRIPTLLIGAGRAGVLAAKEILDRRDTAMDLRGFADDDPEKKGSVIQGLKVLGSTRELERLVRHHQIEQVVLTIAHASRQDIQRIVSLCEQIPVKVRIIPGLYEILGGKVEVSRIRDVQIEDLLGREQVHLDTAQLGRFIAGKVVMITGAGGSIGSELCRQVTRFGPARLLLVERAEPALFHIHRELREAHAELDVAPLLADVADEPRMRRIFGEHRPHVVIHAAAHKHVPLMEENPFETIKNNVLATRLVGEIAGEHSVEVFVLVSTDKAVRPTSMMGASKRIAELVVQDLDRRFESRFLAVRFGNVLGSNGSVIPIFREQIQKGGPVTLTHPDMVRYFMTIPEAAQLVLQAGAMGEGGEIFVLDMGTPVRILDLAKRMIALSGFRPFEDIDIVVTGLRPGEKLFEELETEGEQIAKTRHPKIFVGKIAECPALVLQRALDDLVALIDGGDAIGLRARMSTLLPEAQLAPKRLPSDRDQPRQHPRALSAVELGS